MAATEAKAPDYDELVKELVLIRREGITELRSLQLPALQQAVHASGEAEDSQAVDAPQIEGLLRAGLEDLGGGRLGEAAAVLLGLAPGTRADTPTQLRDDAAERWGVSVSQFRHRWERVVLEQLAEAIVARCHQHQLRLARLDLERKTPTSTRLAVAWVERFEAMYRLWTPIHGLASDLTAYRATLLAAEDQAGDAANGPYDGGWQQQAAGYVTFAVCHFADFLIELRRYQHRYGGLWLLSDHQAEQDLADAVYRVGWHTPNNERDDSYLRTLVDDHPEQHAFLEALARDSIGQAIHGEWQEWARRCACRWGHGADSREPFPTSRNHPDIDEHCQLHAVITACSDYCSLLDDDWRRIADWYRLPTQRPQSVQAEELYREHGPG